jgi:hypothetical protein
MLPTLTSSSLSPKGYELDEKFTKVTLVSNTTSARLWKVPTSCTRKTGAVRASRMSDKYGQILNSDMSWTIDTEHMAWTNHAYFMHCLPVRRGLIVTDDVIESDHSYRHTGGCQSRDFRPSGHQTDARKSLTNNFTIKIPLLICIDKLKAVFLCTKFCITIKLIRDDII